MYIAIPGPFCFMFFFSHSHGLLAKHAPFDGEIVPEQLFDDINFIALKFWTPLGKKVNYFHHKAVKWWVNVTHLKLV